MGFREDLAKRIDRKRTEVAELETQVRLAREYLQALEDTLKIAPKDTGSGSESTVTLRAGTSLAKARDAIRSSGRPLHINDLLVAIGKGTSRNERAGLSGTLAAYVRRGEVFTRPAPNTFGLVDAKQPEESKAQEAVPPAGFGKL
jgi:hypothetical protein